jgi:abortive infection bacteriophage resistance protein
MTSKTPITVKPPTTHEEQVNILKSRGLIIGDAEEAAKVLEFTNYYRLRGYYIHLLKDNSDDFKEGVTFEQILALHDFDNSLRILLLRLLLDIEIVARTRIAYSIAHTWGPLGYRDEANYHGVSPDLFTVLMSRIDDDLNKSHERFIKTYNQKYAGQFPIWVAVEVMSFGDLSKLYHLLPGPLKKKISSAYDGLDETLLTNWIQCCAVLRNLCAHNSRIFSRNIPIPIKIESATQTKISVDTKGKFKAKPQTLFSYLLAIQRISNAKVWNSFLDDFDLLLQKYSDVVEPIRLGMPYQWRRYLSKKSTVQ